MIDRRTFVGLTVAGAGVALVGQHGQIAAQDVTAASPVASPTAGEGRYASVNGVNLFYTIHGENTAGTPLVLLHGGLLTGTFSFAAITPELAKTRPVIVPDLRSHGGTADVAGPLRYEDMADDIAGLLSTLGIAQADLFGYSLGGGVAWQVAIRHPEMVRRLAIASSPVRMDGWYPEAQNGFTGVTAAAAEAMQATPLYQAYLDVAPRPEDWPTLIDKVGQLIREDFDWTDAVAALTVPTFFVIGDSDSVSLEHAIEVFRLRGGGIAGDFAPLPQARLSILSHTAHSALLFRTDWFVNDFQPFLDEELTTG